jgi:hypothetical protein
VSGGEGGVAESVLEKEVAGEYTTFKVYLFMLRVGEATSRDAYSMLGLSSPSLAVHHLEKLERHRLVSRDEWGTYHVVRRKFGVLRFFFVTGRWLIPRTFFYMIFYFLIAVGSVFLLPFGVKEIVLVLSLVGVVTNFVETIYFYKVLPRRSKS